MKDRARPARLDDMSPTATLSYCKCLAARSNNRFLQQMYITSEIYRFTLFHTFYQYITHATHTFQMPTQATYDNSGTCMSLYLGDVL